MICSALVFIRFMQMHVGLAANDGCNLFTISAIEETKIIFTDNGGNFIMFYLPKRPIYKLKHIINGQSIQAN